MAALALLAAGAGRASAGEWAATDVFVGIGSGRYQVYDGLGVLRETVDSGLGGVTVGAAFHPTAPRLYATMFSVNRIAVFESAHPHVIAFSVNLAPLGGHHPESIAFHPDGSFFVGCSAVGPLLHLDAAGALIQSFSTSSLGFDCIDLAADGHTVFYTAEGNRVLRYDTATSTLLPDFAVLVAPLSLGHLRLLPPYDGSGGLLVCDKTAIRRLDGAGNVVQTYDVAGFDNWYAVELEPNGASFWALDFLNASFARFALNSGAVEVGPIATGLPPNTVYGLALRRGDGSTGAPYCSGDGTGAPCPCGNFGAPGHGCANSVAVDGARLAGSGFPSVANDTLVLAGSGMPNGPALYFQGTTTVAFLFGDGLRCVGSGIIRLGTKVNVAGASAYPEAADVPISVRGADQAGDVRHYQVWYRDAAAFCTPTTFNLSNGLSLTWFP